MLIQKKWIISITPWRIKKMLGEKSTVLHQFFAENKSHNLSFFYCASSTAVNTCIIDTMLNFCFSYWNGYYPRWRRQRRRRQRPVVIGRRQTTLNFFIAGLWPVVWYISIVLDKSSWFSQFSRTFLYSYSYFACIKLMIFWRLYSSETKHVSS